MHKILVSVFGLIGIALLSVLLYWVLFGQDGRGGALEQASRVVEVPIAKYYYDFAYSPSVETDSKVLDGYDIEYSVIID